MRSEPLTDHRFEADDVVEIDEQPPRSFFGKPREREAEVVEYEELDGEFEDDEDAADEEWEDEPTPAKRRSRSAHRPSVVFLNFLVTCGVLGTVGVGALAYQAKNEFEARGPLAADTSFTVREGSSLTSVSRELVQAGLIPGDTMFGLLDGPRLFTQAARLSGDDRAVKVGEFAIPAGASMKDILNELTNGSPIELRITIPEGLTVWQAAQRIAANPDLTGDLPTELPPEGSLAAETVSFARGETREAVLERLTRLQAERLQEVWEQRAEGLPLESPDDLLTLASIVEKETGLPDERAEVAAVFMNRLREGWHLNTDPSVVYGVFGGEGLPSGRPITKSDLRNRNPYNTYIFRGLPPGPIAIPGLAALKAAANPAETKAMYFVADGTGGHAFAESAEEHNRNVQQWRRIERGEIEPPIKESAAATNAAQAATPAADAAPVAGVKAAPAVSVETVAEPTEAVEPVAASQVPLPLTRPL